MAESEGRDEKEPAGWVAFIKRLLGILIGFLVVGLLIAFFIFGDLLRPGR